MRCRWRRAVAVALAFAAYLMVSLIFFGRTLPGHLGDYYIGRDTDPSNYMWALAWWPYVLRHRVHPFLTQLLDAPIGMNLASAPAPLPLLGIVVAPLTTAIGPIATFNLVSLMLPPLAAVSAFILCRKLSGSFSAALFGGFVFGFSPYAIGQLLSHMNLLLIFPIPLALYLVICRAEGSISRNRFVGLLTLVLSLQFLLVLEPFAMTTFIGAMILFLALRFASEDERERIRRMMPEIAAAYAFTVLLIGPYLYFYFAYEHPTRPLWPSLMYSADLLNFIVPTRTNAIGTLIPLGKVAANFPGNIFEQSASLGVPLIIAVLWYRRHRTELMPRLLLATVAISAVLALGPFLNIAGHPTLPMPWLVMEKLPLIKGALPIRLTLFAFLALSIVLALWLSDPRTHAFEKAIGTLAMVVMLMPNPSASFWTSPVRLPAFFRDGTSARLLASDDIVLPLPFGLKGMASLWQASSGMNFRLVSGLNGLQPIEIRRWPVANVFYGSFDLPEPELQLKAFLANLGITAIVVDATDARVAQWRQLLSCLNIAPTETGGVILYRIDRESLHRYRAMNAVEMEQRADRARFEALIAATDRYLANGGDASAISVPALEAAGLFPADWRFDHAPNTYRDLWSGPVDGRIGLGVVGTRSSLVPIMQSYSADARKTYFPYPRRWPSAGEPYSFIRYFFAPQIWGSTSGESLQLMVMEFDPPQLQRLATRVSSQRSLSLATPPREASR